MAQETTAKNDKPFRVIFPKKGRLKEEFADVAATAGFTLSKESSRLDYGVTQDAQGKIDSFETLVQRAGDALDNINDGLADMAVVGLDRFEEASCKYGDDFKVRIVGAFNFSACALWIAAPKDCPVTEPKNLEGKRIVTSYPAALKNWLKDNGVENVKIIAREGGVEDYIRLGLADIVCDVVESGSTLKANGLEKNIKLFDSTAILVQRRGAWTDEAAEQAKAIRQRLLSAEAKLLSQQGEVSVPAEPAQQQRAAAARPG